MIKSAKCACGNTTPSEFVEYDGCLGYEAIICKHCGRFADHTGEHEADEWSKQYIRGEEL